MQAPAKAPVMGLHHGPEDNFQDRTQQNLYFSERKDPDNTGYIGIWNGFHGNVDFLGKPVKITNNGVVTLSQGQGDQIEGQTHRIVSMCGSGCSRLARLLRNEPRCRL